MYFGKLKSDDCYGFDFTTENFKSFVEVDDKKHIELIEKANSDGKIIIADAEGNPILVDPPAPTEEEQIRQKILELEIYLSQTDWYAIRFADTGEPIPEEIKQKRQEARDEISALRNE